MRARICCNSFMISALVLLGVVTPAFGFPVEPAEESESDR
jgi:hypothetical protein